MRFGENLYLALQVIKPCSAVDYLYSLEPDAFISRVGMSESL
jgi:hypothetical protein